MRKRTSDSSVCGPSPGLTMVMHVFDNATRKSWTCLNGSLQTALNVAITCGMKFAEGDIDEMPSKSYWFHGESLYSLACGAARGSDNLSFAKEYERYVGRKPWLWSEAVKTPSRLYVGAQFTWDGRCVKVTSFNDKAGSLTACSYKPRDKGSYENKIDRRYTITWDELTTKQREADARVRKIVKAIDAAETREAADEAYKAAMQERTSLRHFDVETIRASYEGWEGRHKKRQREAREAYLRTPDGQEEIARLEAERIAQHDADLERWRNGEDVHRYFRRVALRIKDGYVETSTGQRATIAAAKAGLAFARKHRKEGWEPNGESFLVDSHHVKFVRHDGCKVGCTFIPWEEIDRIAPLLRKVKA